MKQKSTEADDSTVIGARLKKARQEAGLSQRQLSFTGCTPAYISRIEAGQRTPSHRLIRELAQRLGASESWLATGRESCSARLLREAEIAFRLENEEVVALLEQALAVAEQEGDRIARSQALEQLGQLAFRDGELRRAVELLEQALAVGGQVEADRPSLAESLARAHAALGNLDRSIPILEQCLERFQSDSFQYVRFATLLCAALTDAGRYVEAQRVIDGALSRGKEVGDPVLRARLYWSESRLLAEQGNSAAAEEYAIKTLETLRPTENTRGVVLSIHLLAHILVDLERPAEALELLNEGRPMLATAATPLEIAQYRIEEARALAALGEHERAAALAMELTQQLDGAHPVDAGRSYWLLAEIFLELGQLAKAHEISELSVELLEQQPPGRYLIQAYKQLATIVEEQGDINEAYRLLKQAVAIQEQAHRLLS
jgi:transcriptional regulator with XRE-family HTH domain